MINIPSEGLARIRGVLTDLTRAISSHTTHNPRHVTTINPSDSRDLLMAVRRAAVAVPFADIVGEIDRTVAESLKAEERYSAIDEASEIFTQSADGEVVDRVQDLKNWWTETGADEIEMVADKAVTYGSNSMTQLGRKMAQLQGRRVDDEEAQELGCWVYACGKMERWTDAVMRGERPKSDTITDLHVYAMMALRIRHSGGWPDAIGT